MIGSTRQRLMGALAVVALGLAACGSDSPSGEDGPPPSSGSGDGGATETSVDAESGGSLAEFRYATFYEPSRLDPHLAANAGDANVLFLSYDRLVHLDAEAQPIPGLAESWEYDDTGTVLTMKIREGVTFHDGAALDAEAVKANLDRAMTLEGSIAANDLSLIESVEVTGPFEVQITLSQPQASLLAILSDRHGAMISPAAFENADLITNPVGAGMYKIVEYRPGDRAVYEPYDGYWDDSVDRADRFEYVFIADQSTRLNAVRTGELDVVGIEASQIGEAEAEGLVVDHRTTVVYQQLYMNRAREPFDNVDVRRALNHAIDREALVEGIAFGYGEPNVQVFPTGYWAHNPEIGTDFFDYNPERARELLADAGYPDGFEFELLLPTPGTPPEIAEFLQSQLAEIGVTVNIVQTPAQGVADLFFVQEEGVSMLGVWSGRQDPSMTTQLRWTAEGFSNPGGHSTPEVEALHLEALAATDPAERESIVHEMVALATEDAFDLVLYNPVTAHAGRADLGQMPTIILNGKVEFRNIG